MDSNGARHLRRRLDSHEQWRRAAAVQCGDQAAADPDANDLVDFAHGIRRYRDGLCKRLVGGLKSTGTTTSEVNGRFVLKKGTGAYVGLHGTGKIHATLDSASGAITAVYTGRAHVDGG